MRQFLVRRRFKNLNSTYDTWKATFEMMSRLREFHSLQDDACKKLQKQYDEMKSIISSRDVDDNNDSEEKEEKKNKIVESKVREKKQSVRFDQRRVTSCRLANLSMILMYVLNSSLIFVGCFLAVLGRPVLLENTFAENIESHVDIVLVFVGIFFIVVAVLGFIGGKTQMSYNKDAMKRGGKDYASFVGEKKSLVLFLYVIFCALMFAFLFILMIQLSVFISNSERTEDCERMTCLFPFQSQTCVDEIIVASDEKIDFLLFVTTVALISNAVLLVVSSQLRFCSTRCSLGNTISSFKNSRVRPDVVAGGVEKEEEEEYESEEEGKDDKNGESEIVEEQKCEKNEEVKKKTEKQ